MPSDADPAGSSSVKNNAPVPTYASIAGANRAGNMNHMNNNNNFRQVVATVVYANQRDKDRRAKSITVNGLMPNNGISDSDNFHQLCISEFSINAQIISTRRLGKSSDGRVRPLLVSLSSKDVADDIIKHDQLLRRSTVSTVRDNVFINRNLTKIEAQLAYNERCQRRQRLQQRQRQQPQPHQPQQAPISSPYPVPSQHVNSVTNLFDEQQPSASGCSHLVSVPNSSAAHRPDAQPFTSSGSSAPINASV